MENLQKNQKKLSFLYDISKIGISLQRQIKKNISNDNESCILVVAQTHDMTLWGAPLCSYIQYIIGLAGHNVLQALFLSSPIH